MGWGQEQQATTDRQVTRGRLSPPSAPSTTPLRSPGLDPGQSGCRLGGASSPPPPARGPGSPTCLSPGSPRRGRATAWAAAGAPVAYPRAAAHGMAPACSPPRLRLFGDLFREPQGRAGRLQELKLLCKERRRRAPAGGEPAPEPAETAGPPPPPAGLQSPPPGGAEPNGEVAARGAGLLIRQARCAPVCPRRAVQRGLSIRARGGSFAAAAKAATAGRRAPPPTPCPAPQPPKHREGVATAAAAARQGAAGQGLPD